jgi:hypothetical protein
MGFKPVVRTRDVGLLSDQDLLTGPIRCFASIAVSWLRPAGEKPDWTFNMVLRHGVHSWLEYAKSLDLKAARALSNPDLAPHLEFVDLGDTAMRRSDCPPMRCAPSSSASRARCPGAKNGRRPTPVPDRAHCRPLEERRAPAAKNIRSRRRRWTGDLTA